jgi:hypothetical protein
MVIRQDVRRKSSRRPARARQAGRRVEQPRRGNLMTWIKYYYGTALEPSLTPSTMWRKHEAVPVCRLHRGPVRLFSWQENSAPLLTRR